jgi:hypothetical protein
MSVIQCVLTADKILTPEMQTSMNLIRHSPNLSLSFSLVLVTAETVCLLDCNDCNDRNGTLELQMKMDKNREVHGSPWKWKLKTRGKRWENAGGGKKDPLQFTLKSTVTNCDGRIRPIGELFRLIMIYFQIRIQIRYNEK